jgi:two-component system, cell cycle response regulator
MLRPYHASDVSPHMLPGTGRLVGLMILSGTLVLFAIAAMSPIGAASLWRWLLGGVCMAIGAGAAAFAITEALGMARRWRTAAVVAQHQLLLPQIVTVTDPMPSPPITEAVTAPLAAMPSTPASEPAPMTPAMPETEIPAATEQLSRRSGAVATATQTAKPHSVVFDPLTGAVTYSALMARLETDVAFAIEHDRPLALALFDLDNFRTINTLYGFPFGDEVLFALAERLRAHLTEDALLARMGTDRFAVVWSGTPFPQARALTESLLGAVATQPLLITDPTSQHQERLRVTMRAGLAHCPDDGRDAAALIDLAEHALQRHEAGNALRDSGPLVTYPTMYADAADTDAPHAEADAEQATDQTEQWPPSYLDVMLAKNGSIQALASAMEAREVEGVDHARNLAELAQETALLLGRSVEESRLVGLAALLHDVGNLGIPIEILQKNEPLSSEEWAFVREHPHLGQRLLTSVGGVLAAIAPIIAAQRERWDGTGYPLGTRGEAIPLGARIVAVCDVYGALISERPYRAAFTHEEALAELKRCAGTQFDPAVIDAFISSASA